MSFRIYPKICIIFYTRLLFSVETQICVNYTRLENSRARSPRGRAIIATALLAVSADARENDASAFLFRFVCTYTKVGSETRHSVVVEGTVAHVNGFLLQARNGYGRVPFFQTRPLLSAATHPSLVTFTFYPV